MLCPEALLGEPCALLDIEHCRQWHSCSWSILSPLPWPVTKRKAVSCMPPGVTSLCCLTHATGPVSTDIDMVFHGRLRALFAPSMSRCHLSKVHTCTICRWLPASCKWRFIVGVHIGAALPLSDVLSDVLQGLADPANMPRASGSVAPVGDHPSMLLVDPYRQALRR